MQTSFMHPPFGFALFYLRSVAPRDPYVDRVTGKHMEPVTTGQIYWGAVPFVMIQCIMVALVITFPRWSCTTRARNRPSIPVKIEDRDSAAAELPPLDFGPPAQIAIRDSKKAPAPKLPGLFVVS